MTLQITSNKIYIQNPSGTTKFDSNNKLLYKVGYASGSASLNSSTTYLTKSLGFTLDSRIIPVVSIKITSCNGSIGSTMINVKTPITGAFPIHWEGFVHNSIPCAIQENLEVIVDGGYLKAQTKLYDPRSSPFCKSGTKSISFTYEVHAYKHQNI